MSDAAPVVQLAQAVNGSSFSTPSQMLVVLLMAGLMGVLGQGARAIVGLKGMADDAKSLNLSPNDLFQSARLLTSLMIGAVVGLAAGVIFIGSGATGLDWKTLLGFVSAGYTGTDFLEGFISKYLGPPAAVTAALAAKNVMLVKPEVPAPTPSSAKGLVYMVIKKLRPSDPFDDNTQLSVLGWDDAPSKDNLRWEIDRLHWRKVVLGQGALTACAKVSDVTKVVAKADGEAS